MLTFSNLSSYSQLAGGKTIIGRLSVKIDNDTTIRWKKDYSLTVVDCTLETLTLNSDAEEHFTHSFASAFTQNIHLADGSFWVTYSHPACIVDSFKFVVEDAAGNVDQSIYSRSSANIV